jgi:hypothetical protein
MKITKRQLKRIIKEEKRKVLQEGMRAKQESLAIAIQDYVTGLSDYMDYDSIEEFMPDVIGQVEDWFENQPDRPAPSGIRGDIMTREDR